MPVPAFEKSQVQNHPDLHILNDNIFKHRKICYLPFDILYVLMFYLFLAFTLSIKEIPFLQCKD